MVAKQSLDKLGLGLLIGGIVPLLFLGGTAAVIGLRGGWDKAWEFFAYGQTLSRVLCLCVLPVAVLFFVVAKRDMLRLSRGLLTASMLYAIAVFIIYFVRL